MTDIRPMNFGEILDGALVIYRRHFGLFLQLAVVTLSVPLLLLVYLGIRSFGALTMQPPNLQAVLLFIPVAIVYYLASLVLTAGTIRIISDSYLGRPPRLRDALSLGLSRLWPLVGVGLGKGILVCLVAFGIALVMVVLAALAKGGGALAGILLFAAGLTGVWFVAFVLCGYGVTTPVVTLEDLASSFDAFGRSWDLTRGLKLRVLGLGVVAFLLFNLLPNWVFQGLSAVTRGSPTVSIALSVLATIVPAILTPAVAAVVTLMYYDLRVRREAFDLQVLGQRLGII